jgi:hypothetical protein
VSALSPVPAVTIDNLAPARPQTGLTDANVGHVLPVEGGLSRILAVFSSHFPPVVGPVRPRPGRELIHLELNRTTFAIRSCLATGALHGEDRTAPVAQ